MTESRDIYDVIIIGLGASGIAAYSKLKEKNLKVLGLEASSRTGGRVHSVKFADEIIDLGAEWCHGQIDNSVYELVKDLNVLSEPEVRSVFSIIFFDSNGKVPKELGDKYSSLISKIFFDGKTDLCTDFFTSLGQVYENMFRDFLKTPEFSDIPQERADELLDLAHKYDCSVEGCDTWYELAGSTNCEYWDCEGDLLLHWKGKGYRTVLDILLKTHPNPHSMETDDRYLNKEVSNIKLINIGDDDCVEVTCKDNSIYTAQHVIVTCSLGVLKERHMTMFTPALPTSKINTINNLYFGTVNKIFVRFETLWWDNSKFWFSFLWSIKEKQNLSTEDKWLADVFGANGHSEHSNDLCFWVTGESSRHMETLPLENVKNGILKIIDIFFKKAYAVTDIKEIIRSQWNSNPLVRGSYSFRSVNADITNSSSNILAAPILSNNDKPLICFAGEATSTHYYSTVNGAVDSGFRESQRLIDFIEGKTSNVLEKKLLRYKEKNDIKTFKVIIVGAGMAGLGAAKTLQDSGIKNIKIIEASTKVGGRVDSYCVNGDEFIEFGAQWMHGLDNELGRFATANNLLSDVRSSEGEGKFLKENGTEYLDNEIDEIHNIINKILKDCESFYMKDDIVNFSVGEYLDTEFKKHLKDHVKVEDHDKWNDILNWHIKFHLIDNSCDSLNHLSAKKWGQYSFGEENIQNHINFKNGFISLVDKLAKIFPENTIKTSITVENIVWNSNNNNVRVFCSNGKIYEAEHVIITISLGALKMNHKKIFSPQLPEHHITAIESMGFGRIGKIFLEYKEPWWGTSKGFQLIWSQKQSEDMEKSTSEDAWLKYITGFDTLKMGPKNILLGWIASDGERAIQCLPLNTIKTKCHKLLQTFTGNKTLEEPIKVYRSLWGENPNVWGGFSHITRKCDEQNVDPSTLAEPICNENNKPQLLLAGEACHKSYFSTVHGAFESGVDQARKIIQANIPNSKI